MTDQSQPQAAAPSDQQTLVYNFLHALLVLLGTLGVAVPPILGEQSVLMTVAGGLCALVGAGLSLWSHCRKNDVIQTQAAKLALGEAKARKKFAPHVGESQ